MNNFVIALCGNANCGKTTLFNALTGDNQKTGNWAGVTVEKKMGTLKNHPNVEIVDLPGVTSLAPFTADEKVASGFVTSSVPNLIVNVVDCTCLQKSLLLTEELAELDMPMVIALNLCDVANKQGLQTNVQMLEQYFGVPVCKISATEKTGLTALVNCILTQTSKSHKTFAFDCKTESVLKRLEKYVPKQNARYFATQLLEQNENVFAVLKLTEYKINQVKNIVQTVFPDGNASLAITEQRLQRLKELTKNCINKTQTDNKQSVLDTIVLNKYLALPCFALITFAVFYISMGKWAGGLLTSFITDRLTPWLFTLIQQTVRQKAVCGFICDGVLGGVLSVLSFVPQIMLLYGAITFLEESGYMARMAFVTDNLLCGLGLSGKSFVCMLLGTGCTVPACFSTRTLKSERERQTTLTTVCFVPCSAKLAVIAFVSKQAFPNDANLAVLFATSFYLVSVLAIVVVCLFAKILSNNQPSFFTMELPPYRLPETKTIWKQMCSKGKSFAQKAGTIILASSAIIWFLQSFDPQLRFTQSAENSLLAQMGKIVAPLFTPLGFGEWQFAVATLSGLIAKETVIASLNVTLKGAPLLSALDSKVALYSFVVYNLLTVPCISAISTVFQEKGSIKKGLGAVAIQLATSYLACLLIYQTQLAWNSIPLTLAVGFFAVFATLAVCNTVYQRKLSCGACKKCARGSCYL